MREHVVQEARIHYVIEEGGREPNGVPAYARSWYYVRAPTRDEEELTFARELGKSISPEEKLSRLRRSLLPNALDLVDVDINTNSRSDRSPTAPAQPILGLWRRG